MFVYFRMIKDAAKKSNYEYICGYDDEASLTKSDVAPLDDGNTYPWHKKLIIGSLYFCNQRPGIFVAPFLLVRGWRESRIGAVLFISGLVGLIFQTPVHT